MSNTSDQTITQLLYHYHNGDQKAFDELFELVYEKLHHIAQARRHLYKQDTINTTALIHEAYLKLVDQSEMEWKNRAHFFAVASKVMRHILINYARDQNRQKRGGNQQKVSLERLNLTASGEIGLSDDRSNVLIVLDKALKRFEKVNERQTQVVDCLFFGGMTIKETAAALSVTPSTVKRGWKTAQLWLYREIQKELTS